MASIPQGYPQRGDIVAGDYHIDELLGAGAMGIVLKANQPRLRRSVAIKLINMQIRSDVIAKRFALEAEALGQVSDPHVVTMHDFGFIGDLQILGASRIWERATEGTPFIVLEYLKGTDLERWMEARNALIAVPDAMRYIVDACLGTAAVHKHGIAHRDLKPANLFLCTGDSGRTILKVTDFGVAKKVLEGSDSGVRKKLTGSGAFPGTLPYMAPEQFLDDRPLDLRVDVWALGVILYELLTGRLPFEGERPWTIIGKIINGETPDVRLIRTDASPTLATVISRCLEKDAEKRYSGVQELLTALQQLGVSSHTPSFYPVAGDDVTGSGNPPKGIRASRVYFVMRFVVGKYKGGEIPITDAPILIGRTSDADVVLVEDMVSRKHARITVRDGEVWIEDLGSTNGTFVNGEQIKRTRLKERDRILIGTNILRVLPPAEP